MAGEKVVVIRLSRLRKEMRKQNQKQKMPDEEKRAV